MTNLVTKVRSLFTRRDEGASLAEYALLLALIALVCIAVVTALGVKIQDIFTDITAGL